MNYLLNGLPYFPGTSIFGTGLFGDGTAAAPSISFAADSDTGIYRYAANSIGFATGGANRFFMSGSQFGGVTGQNIDMPAAGSIALVAAGTNQNITLTPSGTGMIDGVFASNGISGIRVSNTNGGASAYAVGYFGTTATPSDVVIGCVGTGNSAYGGANSGFVGTNGNKAFAFLTNGAEVARFHANGRLGIGTGATDSANGILQLASSTATNAGIGFGAEISLYRIASTGLSLDSTQGSMTLQFRTSSGSAGYVNASGVNMELVSYGGTVTLKSNNTTALTLDASQQASFASNVIIPAGNYFAWTNTGNTIGVDGTGFSIRTLSATRFTIVTATGNVSFGTAQAGTSATNTLCIPNGTAPTTSPAGGGQLYVEAGALKFRGSGGTVTTVANA